MKMTILIGAPGSGKSTWTKLNRPQARVASADKFFEKGGRYEFDVTKLGEAHGACFRTAMDTCRSKFSDVVIDNTNTTPVEIAPYLLLAQATGYDVEILVFGAGLTMEEMADRNVHGVPIQAIGGALGRITQMLESWAPWWPKPQFV